MLISGTILGANTMARPIWAEGASDQVRIERGFMRGWPFPFMGQVDYGNGLESGWSLETLFFDLYIAVLIFAAVALCCEWWIRRRKLKPG